jgi:flagella basal body P-ring formation protein FlgA
VQIVVEELASRVAFDARGTLAASPDPAARTGRTSRYVLTIIVGPRGGAVRVGDATAVVRVSGSHLRARRTLGAGHMLAADDLDLVDGPIDGVPLRHLPGMTAAIGTRTLRPIAEGEPLVEGAIATGPAIRAGDRVRASVRVGDIEAVVVAVAEQSGRTDQVIRVVNPDSHRAITVRVVSAGEVEVLGDR